MRKGEESLGRISARLRDYTSCMIGVTLLIFYLTERLRDFESF